MAIARLVLVVGLFAISCLSQPTNRILDGNSAIVGEVPYAASIRLDGAHICGGSIISAEHILTAAHCVVDDNHNSYAISRLSVRVGSINQLAGGKLPKILSVSVHPDYEELKNDIAILKIEQVTWSSTIASIAIAKATDELPVGATVSVAGWGEGTNGAASYKLQTTTFNVANEDECLNAFVEGDASILCLNHDLKQGSCRGDAGNGAVYQNELVGVSNLVIGACGSRYPDIFSNVAYYSDWIESQIN